jgi:hypothetical protein
MKLNELIKNDSVFCPICNSYFAGSSYLKKEIIDQKVLWIANMITHYRHNHITSWNKCWGRHGGSYRVGWFTEYEEEKKKVNERAKRQIFRKCQRYMNANGIGFEHVEKLQTNSSKTLDLAKKLLNQQIMEELFK